ncbi:MAG TPA: dihydroorotate dehydrogenase electron transfer subunit [Spirochaetales bacterium]|nr:dihydroorotate dehydrogenase electron transfer subunit [Spirochaetales bacterium]
MRHFVADIVLNKAISPSWMLLGFLWPAELEHPLPGQFFTFRLPDQPTAQGGLLRRPLAFAGFDGQNAFSLYQIRGPQTKALSTCTDKLDVLGPLGNAFPLPSQGESAYLVGGGIGCGPILYLFSYLLKLFDQGNKTELKSHNGRTPVCVLGFRTFKDIPNFQMLEKILMEPDQLFLATDDGSFGSKGNAVTVLSSLMKNEAENPLSSHLYACGPVPMLKAAQALSVKTGTPLYVSAEQWMACGIGACQGCVLPLKQGGYVRVCADGPIFAAETIDWEKV